MILTPYGISIIRVGMSGVLLWFGAQELLHPIDWMGYVPASVLSISGLREGTFILLNGVSEIALGSFLFLGLYTRVAAFLTALHVSAIAFSLGYNSIAIRDAGLAAALWGLVFTGAGALAFDRDNV